MTPILPPNPPGQAGIEIYDTTLRDGMQQAGMVLTVTEKLAAARHLATAGVDIIEGGWPGAIPRDTEFFRRARQELHLGQCQLAAFGSTRRPGVRVAADPQVTALLDAETPIVTLVAKSHPRHVELALGTTREENLAMITDTVRYLVAHGRRVIVDAEHYFDGFATDPAYALTVVRAAATAGAETVVLCDTNGGSLPDQIDRTVGATLAGARVRLGIHCHDDTGCAVANTLAAVDAGVSQVQGTAHGYGERCGNANLFTVVANLNLKRGWPVVTPDELAAMSSVARAVSELTAIPPAPAAPYVGDNAFTHKGGLHASAIRKDSDLYQHVPPESVGSRMRVLVSDMGGRSSVAMKARELGYDLPADAPEVGAIADRVKDLESAGYSFETADASFELLLREESPHYDADCGVTVAGWRVTVDERAEMTGNQARVVLRIGPDRTTGTGEGADPLYALDRAARNALAPHFPWLGEVMLTDFQVRRLPAQLDRAAATRVQVFYTDGDRRWSTMGVAPNLISAAWAAIHDAIRYALVSQSASRPLATTD